MTQLFGRRWQVTIGTLRSRELDLSFEVERSLGREPNTCDLKVYNLTEEHRGQLQEAQSVACILEAGYQERTSVIFQGDLRNVRTERDGPDLVTHLETGDGERRARSARVNRSHAPGTTLERVVQDVVSHLGLGQGNTREVGLLSGGHVFRQGTTISGRASEHLDRMLHGVGLEYSVQDGNIQVLRRGQPLDGTAALLTPRTGLIGSPARELDQQRRPIVTAKCLMVPDLVPGRRVRVESAEVTGEYRVERAKYTGDTKGDDWTIELELRGVR